MKYLLTISAPLRTQQSFNDQQNEMFGIARSSQSLTNPTLINEISFNNLKIKYL
jgi:hypothetical protein